MATLGYRPVKLVHLENEKEQLEKMREKIDKRLAVINAEIRCIEEGNSK